VTHYCLEATKIFFRIDSFFRVINTSSCSNIFIILEDLDYIK